MVQKITKKEFINIITSNKSQFVLLHKSETVLNNNQINIIKQRNFFDPKNEIRCIKSVHSNFLVFSNDSRLSFDQAGTYEYFKINDIIIQKYTYIDKYTNKSYYTYLGYYIIK